jgi:hypothetical protein
MRKMLLIWTIIALIPMRSYAQIGGRDMGDTELGGGSITSGRPSQSAAGSFTDSLSDNPSQAAAYRATRAEIAKLKAAVKQDQDTHDHNYQDYGEGDGATEDTIKDAVADQAKSSVTKILKKIAKDPAKLLPDPEDVNPWTLGGKILLDGTVTGEDGRLPIDKEMLAAAQQRLKDIQSGKTTKPYVRPDQTSLQQWFANGRATNGQPKTPPKVVAPQVSIPLTKNSSSNSRSRGPVGGACANGYDPVTCPYGDR